MTHSALVDDGLAPTVVAGRAAGAAMTWWQQVKTLPAALLIVMAAGAVLRPSWAAVGATCGIGLLVVGSTRRRGDIAHRWSRIVGAMATALVMLGLSNAGEQAENHLSLGTITLFLAYPLVAWVLLEMAALRKQPCRIDALVTGALGGLSVGIGAWAALSNSVADTYLTAADQFAVVAPLSIDVFVLLVGVRLLRSRPTAFSWWALNGGIGALFVAHAIVLEATLTERAVPLGANLSLGIGCVLIGASFVHPSRASLVAPTIIEPAILGFGQVVVAVIAALATPGVLAFQARTNHEVPLPVTIGAGGVGVVLALYLIDLLNERTRSEHRGNHDRLTGLPNRTLFGDRVERALAHAQRVKSPIAVFFIDVDRFKAINDTFGHSAGDFLLRVVAERLQGCLRYEDTVARISGDEFAVLLPHLAAPQSAITVAERIMAAFAEPVTIAETRVAISASMGIAVGPGDGASAGLLLASADAAMYRAKERGRCGYELYDRQLATRAHSRLELESALLNALENDELVVHYQPIVEMSSSRIVGAEALVRWNHPTKGLLFPGHFVPVAEQSDLVVELGEQVLHLACKAAAGWGQFGLDDLSVSVNVAARQFRYDLSAAVTSALRISGLDAGRLTLELTESAAVDNVELVAATFEELRQLGIRASIDDFGTGYCGLRYLSTLPVDNLKIDKSFVEAMTPTNASIVAATIAMAHSLGLSVTAEGVETEEQRGFLESRNCDRFQGYLLSKPLPEADFIALAEKVNQPVAAL